MRIFADLSDLPMAFTDTTASMDPCEADRRTGKGIREGQGRRG